ncbi:hypothetical protein AAFF_G00028020 [Aldrovandia affinis]|uniref:Uncharacterized protein n=1 Tax=Aldrovandia affinis TaxID=143900 RepID=A0AAD7VXT3_9TELE|nr:hypothetical protein AAFF_G00028020 [Aldrovandia affinis]
MCAKFLCPPTRPHRCRNDRVCLRKDQVCNSVDDCGDNSDEEECEGTLGRSRPCGKAEFACRNNRCISAELQCDHFDDCGDGGSDELHCKACSAHHIGPSKIRHVQRGHKSVETTGRGSVKDDVLDGDRRALSHRGGGHGRVRTPRAARQEPQETHSVTPAATSSSSSLMRSFVSGREVLSAEVYWQLDVIENVMDSTIASKFTYGDDKPAYLTTFGIAPHFSCLLLKVRSAYHYMLLFDESLNRPLQSKLSDVHLRNWDGDCQHKIP